MTYTESQLKFIIEARHEGCSWHEVADRFNRKFKTDKTSDAVRLAFQRHQYMSELGVDEVDVSILKTVRTTRRANSRMSAENRAILDYISSRESLVEELSDMLKRFKLPQVKVAKKPRGKGKKRMTIEVMVSDVHVGKLTDTYNEKVCVDRIKQLTVAVLQEIERNSTRFDVHRVIVALIGDIIESATMHGPESTKGCEYGNSKQVQKAVEILYTHLLLPITQTGLMIDVPAVTGNHDRTEPKQTHHNPGEENVTHVIYHMLEMLCQATGIKNIKFHIAKGPYVSLPIYKNVAVYEHTDLVKAPTKEAMERQLLRRQQQLGVIVDFYRGGHWHEYVCYGRGRIIINDSVPGPDSYSDSMGFSSHAGQTINTYVETTNRPTCFFQSFPVYLK